MVSSFPANPIYLKRVLTVIGQAWPNAVVTSEGDRIWLAPEAHKEGILVIYESPTVPDPSKRVRITWKDGEGSIETSYPTIIQTLRIASLI